MKTPLKTRPSLQEAKKLTSVMELACLLRPVLPVVMLELVPDAAKSASFKATLWAAWMSAAAATAVTALAELLPDSGNSFKEVSDMISLLWELDSDGCLFWWIGIVT